MPTNLPAGNGAPHMGSAFCNRVTGPSLFAQISGHYVRCGQKTINPTCQGFDCDINEDIRSLMYGPHDVQLHLIAHVL